MPRRVKWLYLILSVGGGFTGCAVTLEGFFSLTNGTPVHHAIYLLFTGLYAFGVYSGLRFAENEQDHGPLLAFLWLQVPWLSTPLVGYRFTAGFHVSGAVIGTNMSGLFRLGGDWSFDLLRPIPWGLGVNFFALAMALWLRRQMKRRPPPSLGDADERSVALP